MKEFIMYLFDQYGHEHSIIHIYLLALRGNFFSCFGGSQHELLVVSFKQFATES